MRRFNPFGALLVVLLTAGALSAEDPGKGVSGTRAEPESLAGWEWYQEVSLPAGAQPPRLADFLLPPAVLGRAREDLGDLRLYDAQDRPVDYALRVLASRATKASRRWRRSAKGRVRVSSGPCARMS